MGSWWGHIRYWDLGLGIRSQNSLWKLLKQKKEYYSVMAQIETQKKTDQLAGHRPQVRQDGRHRIGHECPHLPKRTPPMQAGDRTGNGWWIQEKAQACGKLGQKPWRGAVQRAQDRVPLQCVHHQCGQGNIAHRKKQGGPATCAGRPSWCSRPRNPFLK